MSRSDADVTVFDLPGFESNWFYLTCGDTPPPSGLSGSSAAVLALTTRWRQITADRRLQLLEGVCQRIVKVLAF